MKRNQLEINNKLIITICKAWQHHNITTSQHHSIDLNEIEINCQYFCHFLLVTSLCFSLTCCFARIFYRFQPFFLYNLLIMSHVIVIERDINITHTHICTYTHSKTDIKYIVIVNNNKLLSMKKGNCKKYNEING